MSSSWVWNSPASPIARSMETAIREERTIVTFDRHYGQLIFQQGYRP